MIDPVALSRYWPSVSHGADGLEVVFPCQVYVAGADQSAGEVALEDVDHFFLNPV